MTENGLPEPGDEGAERTEAASFYGIPLRTIDGLDMNTEDFRGKVLLIVNTAGECEFTSQYEGLEKIHRRFSERGFTVLAFPSDDFGKEPMDDPSIRGKLASVWGVSFPVFARTPVKGRDKHPLFAWLTDRATNPDFGGKISWNFNKFLVSRKGLVIDRFGSRDEPMDDMIVEAVEEALSE